MLCQLVRNMFHQGEEEEGEGEEGEAEGRSHL